MDFQGIDLHYNTGFIGNLVYMYIKPIYTLYVCICIVARGMTGLGFISRVDGFTY